MANDTSAAGYLVPTGNLPPVPYDDALLDLLQPIFVGIGAFDPTLFRPDWQIADVPVQPEHAANWASLGIARERRDTFHYEAHVDSGAGYDYFQRTEEQDVLVSFYGPAGKANAMQLSDGLMIAQNRVPLEALKMGLVSVGDAVQLPALLNDRYQRRVDVTVTLRRCVERTYGVLTVVDLPRPGVDVGLVTLDNEKYVTKITPR